MSIPSGQGVEQAESVSGLEKLCRKLFAYDGMGRFGRHPVTNGKTRQAGERR